MATKGSKPTKRGLPKEPTDKQVEAAMKVLVAKLAHTCKRAGVEFQSDDEDDMADTQLCEDVTDRWHEVWFNPDEIAAGAAALLKP